MYTFDIEECRLTLPPQISEDFDLSQIMYEVPMSIVKDGTVEREAYRNSYAFIMRCCPGNRMAISR